MDGLDSTIRCKQCTIYILQCRNGTNMRKQAQANYSSQAPSGGENSKRGLSKVSTIAETYPSGVVQQSQQKKCHKVDIKL